MATGWAIGLAMGQAMGPANAVAEGVGDNGGGWAGDRVGDGAGDTFVTHWALMLFGGTQGIVGLAVRRQVALCSERARASEAPVRWQWKTARCDTSG